MNMAMSNALEELMNASATLPQYTVPGTQVCLL